MKYNHQFNYNPLQNALENVFSSSMSDLMGGTMIRKSPQANISENESNFTIAIVAPGLEKSDFKVSIDDGKLQIEVDKVLSNTEESVKSIKNEWKLNQWKRTFKVDNSLDLAAITASYDLGILKVQLPKKEASSKQAFDIEIK
jgi:HSP20 family protein